jgi:AcrR family transcriptional regulator
MEHSNDKRVRRTQAALRSALLALIVERGYEKSSVQSILDRAGVGRATFYSHFSSKEDLLRRSLDQLREHLIHEWRASARPLLRPSGKSRPATPSTPLGFTLAFFRHVDGHRKLYRAIVGRESGMIVDHEMRRLVTDLVKSEIAASRTRPSSAVHTDMAAQYVAGALMSIVAWWLDRSIKLSPEQIDQAFRQMTIPALQAVHRE